jgi:hypothetical protein
MGDETPVLCWAVASWSLPERLNVKVTSRRKVYRHLPERQRYVDWWGKGSPQTTAISSQTSITVNTPIPYQTRWKFYLFPLYQKAQSCKE